MFCENTEIFFSYIKIKIQWLKAYMGYFVLGFEPLPLLFNLVYPFCLLIHWNPIFQLILALDCWSKTSSIFWILYVNLIHIFFAACWFLILIHHTCLLLLPTVFLIWKKRDMHERERELETKRKKYAMHERDRKSWKIKIKIKSFFFLIFCKNGIFIFK